MTMTEEDAEEVVSYVAKLLPRDFEDVLNKMIEGENAEAERRQLEGIKREAQRAAQQSKPLSAAAVAWAWLDAYDGSPVLTDPDRAREAFRRALSQAVLTLRTARDEREQGPMQRVAEAAQSQSQSQSVGGTQKPPSKGPSRKPDRPERRGADRGRGSL
ncbi:hypothetical protein [Micromonospora sp. NBC_00858]|uniref:hypothetical protein n=1 Tax=Micromonospora sp. NBC_00858 TaxID=2975979 RepID=UPI00386F055C|nr:hypothetical protein OG990_04175 [Micromonospora sp. NBC_00858]